METVEALALVSGRVEEEILLRNEYLAAENEILKLKITKPLRFNDHERIRLAKIGKQIEKGDVVDKVYKLENVFSFCILCQQRPLFFLRKKGRLG